MRVHNYIDYKYNDPLKQHVQLEIRDILPLNAYFFSEKAKSDE